MATDIETLQQMDLEQRMDWMAENIRRRMDLNILRVNGVLIVGGDDEYSDMQARFLMVIARGK